jgi:nucleoside-triphosphatase
MKHLLIVGRPGCGKTTLMKALVRAVRGRPVDGFLTEECREHDHRVGFWLSPLDGRQVLLAHRTIDSPVRVGPYRVNLSVLDEVAVPVVRRSLGRAPVLFLDELGRMELASPALQDAVLEALDTVPCVVATAGVAPLPWLDALKRRKDVELIPLTAANRAVVAEELGARLEALCAEDDAVQALQRQADRICQMIVSGDTAPIDIEIQQAALRDAIAKTFPEKTGLYHLLYEGRFRRLWQQFRHA